MNGQGITFDIYLDGELALKVLINPSLTNREVINCIDVFADSLNVAQKEGFEGFGVYNGEIEGRAIQIQRL